MSSAASATTRAGGDRRQMRRSRIVDAGLELLHESDVDDIQMRDVAQRADVALGTLYRYFPSKSRLFGQVMMRWFEYAWSEVELIQGKTGRDRLTKRAERMVTALEKEPHILTLHFKLYHSGEPAVDDSTEYVGRGLRRVFRESIGDDAGNADPDLVADIVAILVISQMMFWARGKRPVSVVRDTIDDAIGLLLRPI